MEQYKVIKRTINYNGQELTRELNITGSFNQCYNYLLERKKSTEEFYLHHCKTILKEKTLYTIKEVRKGIRQNFYEIVEI